MNNVQEKLEEQNNKTNKKRKEEKTIIKIQHEHRK